MCGVCALLVLEVNLQHAVVDQKSAKSFGILTNRVDTGKKRDKAREKTDVSNGRTQREKEDRRGNDVTRN